MAKYENKRPEINNCLSKMIKYESQTQQLKTQACDLTREIDEFK